MYFSLEQTKKSLEHLSVIARKIIKRCFCSFIIQLQKKHIKQ